MAGAAHLTRSGGLRPAGPPTSTPARTKRAPGTPVAVARGDRCAPLPPPLKLRRDLAEAPSARRRAAPAGRARGAPSPLCGSPQRAQNSHCQPHNGLTDFELPPTLEAAEPPEARGLERDEVRLLVSDTASDSIEHAHFRDLSRWLAEGDLVVVNTSGTVNAALPVEAGGRPYDLHMSTRLQGGFWTVELRKFDYLASRPCDDAKAGLILQLPDGARATLLAPYPLTPSLGSSSRLWLAAVELPQPVNEYLAQYGFPIRYRYVPEPWPLAMYQTVFATEPGSAEMPSAGRPFTSRLVTQLVAQGVQFAPILLHTGVASLEDHEPPYEEFYRVPAATAERVNAARRSGHRIVAVGTTVVRALETVTDTHAVTHPGEGWTNLVITAARPLRSVDSLITGLHEPRATHLAMLERVLDAAARARPQNARITESLCGTCHLERAYAEARQAGYLWHEFGDSHLILGPRRVNGGDGAVESAIDRPTSSRRGQAVGRVSRTTFMRRVSPVRS